MPNKNPRPSKLSLKRETERARRPRSRSRAESALTGAIGNLLAVAEAYPELRSVERFAELQEELARTEDKISVSRHIYNDTTLNYNDAIATIPTNLIAGLAGFSKRDYFQAEEDSRQAPEVKM